MCCERLKVWSRAKSSVPRRQFEKNHPLPCSQVQHQSNDFCPEESWSRLLKGSWAVEFNVSVGFAKYNNGIQVLKCQHLLHHFPLREHTHTHTHTHTEHTHRTHTRSQTENERQNAYRSTGTGFRRAHLPLHLRKDKITHKEYNPRLTIAVLLCSHTSPYIQYKHNQSGPQEIPRVHMTQS